MKDDLILACGACGARVQDPEQRTCPNCLDPLTTRTFGNETDLEAFRQDRRAHGAPVPERTRRGGRPGLALALGFAAFVMLVAGGGLIVGAAMSGGPVNWADAIMQAAVPLAMAGGLLQIARKYGGWSS